MQHKPIAMTSLTVALTMVAAAALGQTVESSEYIRGEEAYAIHCASCHGASLTGGFAPALLGEIFATRWREQGADELHAYIVRTMPPANAGALGAGTYADISAYVASQNSINATGIPAEQTSAGPATMGGRIVRPTPLNQDELARATAIARTQRLHNLDYVDTATLLEPAAGDWLHWRRTYDAQGYSPLAQIDRRNADGLDMVWSLGLAPGSNQIAPLVYEGIIFLVSGNQTLAIEGATGDVLWRYVDADAPAGGSRNQPRSIAIGGSNLYVPTIDGRMLALDMRSGDLSWERRIAEPDSGVQLVAGPLVVGSKIIQGAAGCATDGMPGGCFLVALDIESGEETWRVHSIARPGEPGGDSWNGAPLEARFGGGIWSTASYDQVTGLVYVGTGQTYRTATLRQPQAGRGASADALHTDSTLAIDPETGRLVWAFQHLAGDIWDMDWGFERTLVDLDHDGRKQRLVITTGKLGIVDALDAESGAYSFSHDLGLQTLVTAIDPETGRKTTDPQLEPLPDGAGIEMCPSSFGVRNWPATAVDPGSGTLFLPLYEMCQTFFWNPGSAWDISWQVHAPEDGDGYIGRLQAIDLASGETLWTRRQRAPQSSAILVTGGGLVFEGSRDRWFRALDSQTGEPLWSSRLSAAPSAFPVTYEADGRQYIAIVAGGGGPLDGGLQSLTPEMIGAAGSPTLFVFGLSAEADSPKANGD